MAMFLCSSGSIDKLKTDKTLIVDNTTVDTSFTYIEDYHNFDLIQFEITNAGSGDVNLITTLPSIIDRCFLIANRINFNEVNSIQYCTYSEKNLTWARTNNRNCNITRVWGLNFAGTKTETVLYNAQTTTSSNVSISSIGIEEYDLIFFAANSNDMTEIQPCNRIYERIFDVGQICNNFTFNYYSGITNIDITNNSMSSARYFSVVGVKVV